MCSILACCADSLTQEQFKELLARTISRGPDSSKVLSLNHGYLGFNRLSIMGLNEAGMQPFELNGNNLVCNGEIYGFRPLKEELLAKGYTFKSDSDCEILLPLYEQYGTDMFRMLDAEYALVLYDAQKNDFIAARDPIGIRPLYYGYDAAGTLFFASEPKNLVGTCQDIRPFPPGHYYADGKFICYRDPANVSAAETANTSTTIDAISGDAASPIALTTGDISTDVDVTTPYIHDDVETACTKIHDLLVAGIEKRLDADAPVGFLLSGGLDSSLVCGVAAKVLKKPLETFSIGMDVDAIDLKYAREVAEYIHSNHHEVIISKQDVLDALEPVIKALGTYDITTIRASIGMYLVCKWIHENTDIRVILTGEISDELFGYKYTDFAPSAEEFQKEAEKRIREIHQYDVLRADRCISVNSLEARVPFGDLDFVDYVMHLDPALKLNTYGIGKYLPRHAFEKDELIPYSILMRQKAAFSDAVGHSLADDLRELAEQTYSDEEFAKRCPLYAHATPFTKESLLYREIFEKYYPGQSEMVVDFWMPNKTWPGLAEVNDPSARVLSNYGESGT